jgi:hypothetical protein
MRTGRFVIKQKANVLLKSPDGEVMKKKRREKVVRGRGG